MCGITAGVAKYNIAPDLVEGLKRLEYRGYDSAGLAMLTAEGVIARIRMAGKVEQLSHAFKSHPLEGDIGIAHTRWATHGVPSEYNAHPHMSSNQVALVHNGIIENYVGLKKALLQQGYEFSSETDSEAVVHAIGAQLDEGYDLLNAVQKVVAQLDGAYAIAVTAVNEPHALVVAKMGSPLVIGICENAHYVASDPLALIHLTDAFIFLEEGDVAKIYADDIEIYNIHHAKVSRSVQHLAMNIEHAGRGHYRHYMQKEIYEQPKAIQATVDEQLKNGQFPDSLFGNNAASIFDSVKQIQIVGCGTSLHAGMIARYWIESVCKIPCMVDPASELRYMEKHVQPGTLLIAISQSGETADTLAAVKYNKKDYLACLSICNVAQSALMRESALSLLVQAGPEVGVASTKTFTSTLTALLFLVGAFLRRAGKSAELSNLFTSIEQLSRQMEFLLKLDKHIEIMARAFVDKHHALYLGRGVYYPVVLEGALKLKEISYIHAEAYPAGELKHGPLALVDESMPVVVVIANDKLQDKLKSNLQEVRARGGELFIFAEQGVELTVDNKTHVITLPPMSKYTAPILFSIPLQLLSYYIALLKGTNVDQPRNLAKSVTVE